MAVLSKLPRCGMSFDGPLPVKGLVGLRQRKKKTTEKPLEESVSFRQAWLIYFKASHTFTCESTCPSHKCHFNNMWHFSRDFSES